jgi:hypothetical protein
MNQIFMRKTSNFGEKTSKIPAEGRDGTADPSEKAEVGSSTRRDTRIGSSVVKPDDEHHHQVDQGVQPVVQEHHNDLAHKRR